MDGLLPLFRVTPATEVAKKWNVTRKRLNEIVEKIRIPLYSICEKRISPKDGRTVYFCQGPYFNFYHEGPIDNEHYVLEGIYFDTGSIESYENAHPEILWAPADPEFILEQEYGENIPADVIRKLLKMSPIRFIELMNNREGPISSLEEDFKRYRENLYSSGDFFLFLI